MAAPMSYSFFPAGDMANLIDRALMAPQAADMVVVMAEREATWAAPEYEIPMVEPGLNLLRESRLRECVRVVISTEYK
jgi:hypothetical protein